MDPEDFMESSVFLNRLTAVRWNNAVLASYVRNLPFSE